tara:strand:- start:751 stop:1002 length:252 start_codon:yes stop_codon:yes gene_type:complete
MKQLSPKTIKSYSCTKLAKHLDRLMDSFEIAPYRVDFAYGAILEFSKSDSSYHHSCSISDYTKSCITECINDAWAKLNTGVSQ